MVLKKPANPVKRKIDCYKCLDYGFYYVYYDKDTEETGAKVKDLMDAIEDKSPFKRIACECQNKEGIV